MDKLELVNVLKKWVEELDYDSLISWYKFIIEKRNDFLEQSIGWLRYDDLELQLCSFYNKKINELEKEIKRLKRVN